MMNTKISYMYRDGANYKTSKEVIVAGQISYPDLAPYMIDGENFIPDSVGLAPIQDGLTKYSGGVPTDTDHVFHELTDGDFEPTDRAPTEKVTAEELIAAFRAAHATGWPVEDAVKRLFGGQIPARA